MVPEGAPAFMFVRWLPSSRRAAWCQAGCMLSIARNDPHPASGAELPFLITLPTLQASGCASRAASTSTCCGPRACQRCERCHADLLGSKWLLSCPAASSHLPCLGRRTTQPQCPVVSVTSFNSVRRLLPDTCSLTSGRPATRRQSTGSRWMVAHAPCAVHSAPSSMAPSRRPKMGSAGCTR